MPAVDVVTCPFPLLYRGEEHELGDARDEGLGDLGSLAYDDHSADLGDFAIDSSYARAGGGIAGPAMQSRVGGVGGSADPLMDAADRFGSGASDHHMGGSLVDPGLMLLSGGGNCGPVEDKIGEAISVAPTALLIAHLTLRDAINEAEDLLKEVHATPNPVIPPRGLYPVPLPREGTASTTASTVSLPGRASVQGFV